MFPAHCPTCRSTTLLGYRRLRSLTNTAHGIVLRFECPCGAEASLVTGAGAATSAPDHPTAA